MKFVRTASALALASAATIAISLFATTPAQADTSWDVVPGNITATGFSASDTSWD